MKSYETKDEILDFPGGPVVKTPCFYCRGTGSFPGQESSTCREVQPKK